MRILYTYVTGGTRTNVDAALSHISERDTIKSEGGAHIKRATTENASLR